MKAHGPKEERETVIIFSEEADVATIYTSSEVTYRRMKKRGWHPDSDEERHAVFTVPKRTLRLPINPEARNSKRVAKLAKATGNGLQGCIKHIFLL